MHLRSIVHPSALKLIKDLSLCLSLPLRIMISFPSDNIMVISKPVIYFFLLLAYIKFAASVVLYCLGLHDPAEAPLTPPWREHLSFFPEAETSKPAPAPGPWSIKNRLPVVEFSSLLLTRRWRREEEEEDQTTCVICVEELEARHRVRELGNCGHAFHVECIDKWVDVGQVSCPMCRAPLLPSVDEKKQQWRRLLPVW